MFWPFSTIFKLNGDVSDLTARISKLEALNSWLERENGVLRKRLKPADKPVSVGSDALAVSGASCSPELAGAAKPKANRAK